MEIKYVKHLLKKMIQIVPEKTWTDNVSEFDVCGLELAVSLF